MISGVPQGSVLGPTLFLVYINDLGTNTKSTVRLFADDTILYRGIRSQSDTHILQEDLKMLEEWESNRQMSFNVSKYHVLSVSKRKKSRSTSSASALVTRLKLNTVKTRQTLTKAAMMHKIMSGPVDISPACSSLTPTQRSTRGLQMKVLVPHSSAEAYTHSLFPSAIRLWDSTPQHALVQNQFRPSDPSSKTG